MNWIFGISLLIIFELIADVFSKEYALKGNWFLWCGAIAGYIIANIFWLSAIKNGSGLARGAVIFSVGSAIVAVALGLLLYHERMSTPQIAGVGLGIVSLILIFWE